MAYLIPQHYGPDTPPGEQEVFRRLNSAPNGWYVLHSVHLRAEPGLRKGELDFVVIMPECGVLVIEVKSHHTVSFDHGAWRLGNQANANSPFTQADDGLFSLRRRCVRAINSLHDLAFHKAVIFTNARFTQRDSAEWHAHELLDCDQLQHLSSTEFHQWLANSLQQSHLMHKASISRNTEGKHTRSVTSSEIESLLKFLKPKVNAGSARDHLNLRRFQLDEKTKQQIEVLDLVQNNKRLVIEGPAGTGKTCLAVEAAIRYSKNGLKPIFICGNELLCSDLSNRFNELGEVSLSDRVFTLHQIFHDLSNMAGTIERLASCSSEEASAELALEAALTLKDSYLKCDCLVIDEAQDFIGLPYVLDIFQCLLGGGELHRYQWAIFGDFDLQVINSDHEIVAKRRSELINTHRGVPAQLDKNCRNTRCIGTNTISYSGLPQTVYKSYMREDGSEADIRILRFATDGEIKRNVRHAINCMKENGIRANEIVVLYPSSNAAELAPIFKAGSGISLWSERMHSTGHETIERFKGLEADGVVVIIKDFNDRTSEQLYVACSRATMNLTLLLGEQVIPKVFELTQRG